MKTIKKLLVLALVSVVLVGCSNGTTPTEESKIVTEITEPVTITYWHAMNGAQEEALTKLVQDFMAANENITVELQNQSSIKDLSTKLTNTMITPDQLPNITQSYPNTVFDASKDGFLVPIRAYIDNETIGIKDYNSDVPESFRNSGVIDGVEYGIPFNKSSEALFINKTLLDAAGAKVPTNLEEFAEAARLIAENNDGIVGGGFDSLKNYYAQYMYNEGIEFNPELDPTSEASVKTMQFYLDGIKNGSLRTAGSDQYLSGPFGAGLVGMNVGSTAGLSHVIKAVEDKFELVVVKSPFKSGLQQGMDAYIFNTGTDEQKTASFLLLKYLIEPESTKYFAETTGYLPVRKSILESDAYKNSGSQIAAIADQITADMFTLPVLENGGSAYDEVTVQVEAILSNPDGDLTKELETFKTALADAWAQ